MRFLKYLLWIRSWVRILQVISSSASNYTTNGLLPRGQREREHARKKKWVQKQKWEREVSKVTHSFPNKYLWIVVRDFWFTRYSDEWDRHMVVNVGVRIWTQFIGIVSFSFFPHWPTKILSTFPSHLSYSFSYNYLFHKLTWFHQSSDRFNYIVTVITLPMDFKIYQKIRQKRCLFSINL